MIAGVGPSKLTRMHAMGKAKSLVSEIQDGVILAADTVVWRSGKVLGKPGTMREAASMLRFLSGNWHRVVTGVALLRVRAGRVAGKKVFTVTSRVHIKPMTDAQIKSYFKKVHPLDKAGAYAIQSPRISIVDRVVGSASNVAGLPMEALSGHLKAATR